MRGLSACCVFFGLTQAAKVYLSPPESSPSRLSSQQASQVLAAYLGLDQFEQLSQESSKLSHLFTERDFVASNTRGALLLLIDEAYAPDVLPSAFVPNFSFSEPTGDYLPTLLKTYNRRATHAFSYVYAEPSLPSQGVPRTLDIFLAPTPANEAFLAEISALSDYIEAPSGSDRFAGLHLTSIPQLATSYGRDSEQYQLATHAVRSTIETALSNKSIRLALVTHLPSLVRKRSPYLHSSFPLNTRKSLPRPGVCYTSELACLNGTSACSGHGLCMSTISGGNECFACACETTKLGQKTQTWVGQSCERQDISGPFVLISGIVITLLLLMGGAVSLLYAIGGQELPSILTGGVTGATRKD
ncbi:hypothetical protein J3A83DRAFT_2601546 [Scleroderma citrinum]